MNKIQKMAARVMNELLAAYENGYFDATDAKSMSIDFDCSRYEVIIDWAQLCSEEEYEKIQEVDNDYDVAFNRASEAVIKILFG